MNVSRSCRCLNFTIEARVANPNWLMIDTLCEHFKELVPVQCPELYPEEYKERAQRMPVYQSIDPESISVSMKYDGFMQRIRVNISQVEQDVEIIRCGNCRTHLYLVVGESMFIAPNLLCEREPIPSTWPQPTDKPEHIHYDKRLGILYYGDLDDVEAQGQSEHSQRRSSELGEDTISALAMTSMSAVRNKYVTGLKQDIARLTASLDQKLTKKMTERLEEGERATDAVLRSAAVNRARIGV